MDLELKSKVVMVSGASKGLGLAVARVLAKEGALVSIASRDTSAIQAARSEIRAGSKTEVFACAADVRSPEAVERWKEDTVREFGGVDMLFCNTGGPPSGLFMNFDEQAWKDALELLFLSVVRMTKSVIPLMKQRGGGSIVYSTSSSVKEPIDNLTLSNVVRAPVAALAKTLAREFGKEKIRFNHIVPGRFQTDRVAELDEFNAKKKNISVDEQRKIMMANIPVGRYGEVDEFARAAVFLLSPAASYITGATLQVDGGMIKSVY